MGDGKALQSEHLDQRNRPRTEYIERSSQKTDLTPWGLGDQRTREGGVEEGSLGGG
jgi:hypothetical protein